MALKPTYQVPQPERQVWPSSYLTGPPTVADTGAAAAIVPLDAASAVSSATLVLTAPTQVPLQAASAVSSATLALTAQTRVVLNSSDAISSATLTVTAPSTEPIWATMGPLVAA